MSPRIDRSITVEAVVLLAHQNVVWQLTDRSLAAQVVAAPCRQTEVIQALRSRSRGKN